LRRERAYGRPRRARANAAHGDDLLQLTDASEDEDAESEQELRADGLPTVLFGKIDDNHDNETEDDDTLAHANAAKGDKGKGDKRDRGKSGKGAGKGKGDKQNANVTPIKCWGCVEPKCGNRAEKRCCHRLIHLKCKSPICNAMRQAGETLPHDDFACPFQHESLIPFGARKHFADMKQTFQKTNKPPTMQQLRDATKDSCYRCLKGGHTARDCPLKHGEAKRSNPKASANVAQKDDDNTDFWGAHAGGALPSDTN
jgi:hypothetical protein